MDRLYPPYLELPSSRLAEVVDATPPKGRLQFRVEGLSIEGEQVRKTVSVPLEAGPRAADRLAAAGLRVRALGGDVRVERVAFGSPAERVGLEAGFKVTGVLSAADRPSPYVFYAPALLLLGLVLLRQRERRATEALPGAAPRTSGAASGRSSAG